MLPRRQLLAAGLGLAALSAGPARAGAAPRLLALDWSIVETLLVLGQAPLGVPETGNYGRTVQQPALPPGCVDLGLRVEPNLELIQALRPDLVLINSGQDGFLGANLRRIARTETLRIYGTPQNPYAQAAQETRRLAAMLGAEAVAERYLDGVEQRLATLPRAAPDAAPVYLISLLDQRHAMVYGARSIFQRGLDALGLRNAWQRPTNGWGFAMSGLAGLAAEPRARLLHIGPIPPEIEAALQGSRLWQGLPFIREGRFGLLPPLWVFGAVPTAERFSQLLAERAEVLHG